MSERRQANWPTRELQIEAIQSPSFGSPASHWELNINRCRFRYWSWLSKLRQRANAGYAWNCKLRGDPSKVVITGQKDGSAKTSSAVTTVWEDNRWN